MRQSNKLKNSLFLFFQIIFALLKNLLIIEESLQQN